MCHFRFVPIGVCESAAGSKVRRCFEDLRKLSWRGAGEPIIAPSPYKHCLSREDILHAYRNPLRIWDLGEGFTMMIGPNRAALILEAHTWKDVAMVIVHAMPARDKYLR